MEHELISTLETRTHARTHARTQARTHAGTHAHKQNTLPLSLSHTKEKNKQTNK